MLRIKVFICLGITEKLGHLKDIGVTGLWLSPIFKSPMADFGYDISNFTDIDPMFGTLEDFDRLVAKAKELGKWRTGMTQCRMCEVD
jgi:alpha-glucosidase